ncbi:MAG: hypothetical protein KDA47_22295 [Planctomycetales bacterium]|nr:hypothetical protein [Planctomycetales bacterium]
MPESSSVVKARPPLELRPLDEAKSSSAANVIRRPAGSAVVRGAGSQVPESHRVRINAPGALAEPRVELVRDGDQIVAIDVTCGCGQTHRLVCEYLT